MEGFEELNLRRAIINSIESSEEAGVKIKKLKLGNELKAYWMITLL